MTDELLEAFKREIQVENLQVALKEIKARVINYADWRIYDPVTELIRDQIDFLNRHLRSSNVDKRVPVLEELKLFRTYSLSDSVSMLPELLQLQPRIEKEFQAKAKRARKQERKDELTNLLKEHQESFRILTIVTRSVTPSAFLVDRHFRSITHYKSVRSKRPLMLTSKLRPLARARSRVFLSPSQRSLEEYLSTADQVLNRSPNLRKLFLTSQKGFDIDDWESYRDRSQKLLDDLEVAVMMKDLTA